VTGQAGLRQATIGTRLHLLVMQLQKALTLQRMRACLANMRVDACMQGAKQAALRIPSPSSLHGWCRYFVPHTCHPVCCRWQVSKQLHELYECNEMKLWPAETFTPIDQTKRNAFVKDVTDAQWDTWGQQGLKGIHW
jgi:hypothetical protein